VFRGYLGVFRVSARLRAVGGQAEKWRSPFLGYGLAMRCERSEHGKSQLSNFIICQVS